MGESMNRLAGLDVVDHEAGTCFADILARHPAPNVRLDPEAEEMEEELAAAPAPGF